MAEENKYYIEFELFPDTLETLATNCPGAQKKKTYYNASFIFRTLLSVVRLDRNSDTCKRNPTNRQLMCVAVNYYTD